MSRYPPFLTRHFWIHRQFITVCFMRLYDEKDRNYNLLTVASYCLGVSSMTQFVCDVDERHRSACEGLPEYQNTGYCVLHAPAKDKGTEFQQILLRKLERSDF